MIIHGEQYQQYLLLMESLLFQNLRQYLNEFTLSQFLFHKTDKNSIHDETNRLNDKNAQVALINGLDFKLIL